MSKKYNIIVLASGNGTDLGAIIDAIKMGELDSVNIMGVISNRNLGALEKARAFGCPAVYLPSEHVEHYDQKLLDEIRKLEIDASQSAGREVSVDLICLVGYMRILSPEFISSFPNKIINVHPSLLPKFGGKGMYGDHVHEAVLASGESESGMTIHYVSEVVDEGEIILQKTCDVSPNETVDSLKSKVQSLEKIGYVDALKKLTNS